jgi:DNA-directed RNA polymerase subunit RPC12/RpoP
MVDYVKTYKCKSCGDQASGRGHLCHPNAEAGPFKCEYCGKKVSEPRHVCKDMIGKIEYVCKKCGRLAAINSLLCEPELIGGD